MKKSFLILIFVFIQICAFAQVRMGTFNIFGGKFPSDHFPVLIEVE